ncbi:MAG: hypothetical protein IID36_09795 [Planctomycetes bacterium]|nr:hypothetical protein [Planctomycetota bacterium]
MGIAKSLTISVVGLLAAGSVNTVDAAGKSASDVFRLIPADAAVAVGIADLKELDKSVSIWGKRFDPNAPDNPIITSITEEVPILAWADLTAPIGIATMGFGPSSEPIFWLKVPDFAAKAKEAKATDDNGIWQITYEDTSVLFAAAKGDYVVVGMSNASVREAISAEKSLGDVIKGRMSQLGNRNVVLHVDFSKARATALGAIAQAGMFAPMVAMQLAQGGDPTAANSVVNTVLGTTETFAKQLEYIGVGIDIDAKAAEATITIGFGDGSIKSYLAQQEPAAVSLLSGIPDQPSFFAIGFHFPGTASPFFDHVISGVLDAMSSAPATGGGGDGEAGETKKAIEEAGQAARRMLQLIEGVDVAVGIGADGMAIVGSYTTRDARELQKLLTESMTSTFSLMTKLGQGAMYKALGKRRVGSIEIDEFEPDPSGLPGADGLYGEGTRFAIGTVGKFVRFCMGGSKVVDSVFSERFAATLSASKYNKVALAALPATRNCVLLIDPVGLVALAGAMGLPFGGAGTPPPGPPIAISVSFVGDPVRIDIHIPLRAIERVMEATSEQEPL